MDDISDEKELTFLFTCKNKYLYTFTFTWQLWLRVRKNIYLYMYTVYIVYNTNLNATWVAYIELVYLVKWYLENESFTGATQMELIVYMYMPILSTIHNTVAIS